MSTSVGTPPTPSPELDRAPGPTLGNVSRSEWTKLRSLRSTWWAVLAAFLVTAGLSLLIDWAIVANWGTAPESQRATFDATNQAFNGLSLGQLAIAVLGVMAITTEYSTGGIRTTFIAVPVRLRVLAAKTAVVALVGVVVGLVTAFVAFLGGMAIFRTQHLDVGLGDPGVLRAVLGAGLYIAGCGMFGLALGTLLRSTPGAITAVVALLFVLPLLALAIPGDLGDTITKYFTANAGSAITYTRTPATSLGPWPGYLVFTVEWLVVLATGALLLRRRDT